MPHLVEMQRKYAKDGLVVMTVTVDSPDRKDAALKFLRDEKATGPNFLLDEESEFWQTKWKINGPPAAFVFDREGKRARKFDSDDPDKPYDHMDVEKVVKELLGTKP
jgi:peroxiredoxin